MISDFAKEKVFWTRKMNLKLVKFIESRPNIWNPKHPKYTSVNHRDRTYAEFASKYGNEFTGRAVKDRWTNIRSTFANYLRKLTASRAKGDGEEYKINWHLWEACQFLMKVNKKGQYELSLENGVDEDEKKEEIKTPNEWSSGDDLPVNALDESNMCEGIAQNLMKVLCGVQNDAFGLKNTKYGRVGQIVANKLSQMSSYEAAKTSQEIIKILLLYDRDNPENPNNIKNNKSFEFR